MSDLLQTVIQANLYLIIGITAYYAFIKGQKNFSLSRVYILSVVFLSLILPFIRLNFSFPLTAISNYTAYLNEVVINSTKESGELTNQGFHWVTLLIGVYLLGILFNAFKLFFSFHRLLNLKRKSIKVNKYYLLPNSHAAFSFMNWIFIGDLIPEEKRALIVEHEKVHSLKFHSVDLLICKFLEIIFWFNPLIYQLKHLLEEVHEYEADASSCLDQKEYLSLLLNQSLQHYNFPLIHQFNSNHLKNRVMRIKKQSNNKIRKGLVVLSASLLVATFCINQQLFSQSDLAENLPEKQKQKEDLDKYPQFPGGQEALVKFIIKNVEYPKSLIKENLTETIYVEMLIDDKGNITNKKVLKEGNKAFVEAALAAVNKMPKWIPGEKDGKKVSTSMVLPIKFAPPKSDEYDSGFLPGSLNNIRDASGYYHQMSEKSGC